VKGERDLESAPLPGKEKGGKDKEKGDGRRR
jgi:hypothetical protein